MYLDVSRYRYYLIVNGQRVYSSRGKNEFKDKPTYTPDAFIEPSKIKLNDNFENESNITNDEVPF